MKCIPKILFNLLINEGTSKTAKLVQRTSFLFEEEALYRQFNKRIFV